MNREILEELGYSLADDGLYWRTKAEYRGGNNKTAIRINKETGNWTDYSNGSYGNVFDLVKLTLGLKTTRDAAKWLEGKINETEKLKPQKPKPNVPKVFPLKVLGNLFPNYTFYTQHKFPIDESVLKLFKCGVATTGKLNNRIVFPIICHENNEEILGFAGRDITLKQIVKWKIINPKFDWQYPRFISEASIIEKDEVIIVESIGDALALFNADHHNVLVAFGLVLTRGLIKALLELNPSKIVIALNNEPDNESRGNKSAQEFKTKLIKIFDEERVVVNLPTKVDFGEMTKEEIKEWDKNRNFKK